MTDFLIADGKTKSYSSVDGWVMSREYGKTPNGNSMDGRWVLRDPDDKMVGFDRYRYDLAERYGFRLCAKEPVEE